MPTLFPQTPRHLLSTSTAHRKSSNLGKFGLLSWTERNNFCHKSFFPNGLLGPECNLHSLICPSRPLGRTLCPGMSQELGGVVHPDLTFGEEFNLSKYPVSSFPRREGGIRLSVSLCSLPNVYLPRSSCHDPEPILHIRFSVLFPDMCRCLGEPGMAQMALNAHIIQSRINYFFSLMKHDSYTDTSYFNPWAESHRRYQKNPNLLVSDPNVTLSAVSLQGGTLRGLRVEKKKWKPFHRMAEFTGFLGNLQDNSQCQLQSLSCETIVKASLLRGWFSISQWQKKFPSRNWHTGMAKSYGLDGHLGLNLSFPFFFPRFCLWAGKFRMQLWHGLAAIERGRGHREGWTFPEPGSFWLSPPLWPREIQREQRERKSQEWNIPEISSKLTAIAASGISQLRDYRNIPNSPWWVYLSPRHWIAALTPTDRGNISWWWVPLFKNEPCEELPCSVRFDNWVWCHLVLVLWGAVNTHSLLVFSPALLVLQTWILSHQSALWFKFSLEGNCPVTLGHSRSILSFLNRIITKANSSQITHIQRCKGIFKVLLHLFHSSFLPPNSPK